MARHRRFLKRDGIVATGLVLAASLALLLQCKESISNDADGGSQDCPSEPPNVGTACSLPNDQDCTYKPECGCCFNDIFKCVQGVWTQEVITGKPAGPQCPATIPEAGSSCEVECEHSTCSYTCSTVLGTASTATCIGGAWEINADECDAAVSSDDAGNDADADNDTD